MKKFFLLFSLSISGHLVAQTSYIAPTKVLSKSSHELSFSADYFSSTSRVDKDGETFKFEDGESFKRMQGAFQGSYGLTDQLQVSVGARFRSQVSSYSDMVDKDDASAQGLESTWLRLMYAFKPVNRLYYVIEGEYRYRTFSNQELKSGEEQSDMILGDEGNAYSFGLGVTYHSPTNNFFTVRGGYSRPGSELSDEIYYQAEGALVWNRFSFIAGVNGIYSLGRDPNEGEPEARLPLNTGSTFLYHQENREWVAPYLGLNVGINNNWRVELRGSQVVTGKSTDLGTGFGVNIVRRSEKSNPTKKIDRAFKSYDIEASISKISPKGGYVVIDKGLADEVEKGMVFDFYDFDYMGGNDLLARGTVIRVQSETSIIKITSRFKRKPLKEGVLARASFR